MGQPLPTIDISPLLDEPGSPAAVATASRLFEACHNPGFAHLVGEHMPSGPSRQLFEVAHAFFDLPADERHAMQIGNSPAFRGYTVLGDERTGGNADWRDQLDYGPEQAAPAAGHDGPAWLRLRGPNQWPESLPELAPVALAWMEAMTGVGLVVIRALASHLGLGAAHFDSGFVPHSDVHVKIIRYPAGTAEEMSDQGVGVHHDTGLMTMIVSNGVPGLQAKIGDEFVDADPPAGGAVLNLGAMMQALTNGCLQATPHRVVRPSGDTDRISVALFFNPTYESRFDPIELPEHLADRARPNLVDLNGGTIHTLFGENNLKVRLRSHPDVAARHYSDYESLPT